MGQVLAARLATKEEISAALRTDAHQVAHSANVEARRLQATFLKGNPPDKSDAKFWPQHPVKDAPMTATEILALQQDGWQQWQRWLNSMKERDALLAKNDALESEVAALRAKLNLLPENPAQDYHGPKDSDGRPLTDEVHERVHEVVNDIFAGRVTKPARDQLKDALDKAPEPKKGFPNRALSFSNQKIGLILPGWVR